ncbi:MAG TPA: YajQ family cyclic di-GMP-binding protein [Alphaproteobacteria bacterium]|nr:YajQ family cyclic di-GMP-binding protein [Alphaproteobacteria bacterium]
MPSFDIVSKTDLTEVDNALANIAREIATRFDFKNSQSKVTRDESVITLLADNEPKLKQLHELLTTHIVRRKLDPSALDYKEPARASGDMVRQQVIVKQGIDRELAKRLIREIKDSKLKTQASIQGDELRISGKKKDDLQDTIALIKRLQVDQPLQFVNFRD